MFEFPSGLPGHGPIHATRPNILERSDESCRTMGDIFLRAVRTAPTKNFLGTRSFVAGKPSERGAYKWLTYGAAGVRVGNIAAGLKTLGMHAKDTIGIVAILAWPYPPRSDQQSFIAHVSGIFLSHPSVEYTCHNTHEDVVNWFHLCRIREG
jgi:hypothetical protein